MAVNEVNREHLRPERNKTSSTLRHGQKIDFFVRGSASSLFERDPQRPSRTDASHFAVRPRASGRARGALQLEGERCPDLPRGERGQEHSARRRGAEPDGGAQADHARKRLARRAKRPAPVLPLCQQPDLPRRKSCPARSEQDRPPRDPLPAQVGGPKGGGKTTFPRPRKVNNFPL